MSEETKTTSAYRYEDDFCYLTEEGELYLKGGMRFKERKVADLEEEEVESKIQELRQNFSALEEELEDKLAEGESEQHNIDSWIKKFESAEAVGDFDSLLKRIEESTEPVAGEDEKEAKKDLEDTEAVAAGGEGSEEEAAETDEALKFYEEIVEKAGELSVQSDWPYVSMELDNLEHQWSEGPDTDADTKKALYDEFQQAVDHFERRKKEHYQELKRQKKENLERTKELLAGLEEIVSEEKWTAVKKVNQIKGRWNNTGILPSGESDGLDKQFEELLGIFEEHKVDRLVQQRQKEEDNLVGKLVLLDKMEQVTKSIDENVTDWKALGKEFDRLTSQWKKIGKVPGEKSQEVWERFKAVQDAYYNKKYEFDEVHRKKVDKYTQRKEKLCEQAEALMEEEDLAGAARTLNKLHRKWKKAGNLPQRKEDELWARFKAATDAFNERKSGNIDLLKEQEEENYREKLKLIEQAEAVKETDDWDEGHKVMQSLMDKWKKTGPVPRKKSREIWKQFKGAMDVFYDRRRAHFKEVKASRRENLQEKKEILDKLHELSEHEDPIEAVELAKPLQEAFKDAGYVPIQKKNKMWKQYREVCDIIYDRFRGAKSGNKFDRELARMDLDAGQRAKIQRMRKKHKQLKKEVRKLEEEVIHYKESKTYFKPSGKGNALIEEIQQKIDRAESELKKKQEELEDLLQEIESLKAEA